MICSFSRVIILRMVGVSTNRHVGHDGRDKRDIREITVLDYKRNER